MKLVIIDSNFTWKIQKVNDTFIGKCGRLNLSAKADTFDELIAISTEMMYNLFKDQVKKENLNEYAFQNAVAYRVRDFEGFIDLNVPLILQE
jgi:hypothetical protein